jgi:hypothetical protein
MSQVFLSYAHEDAAFVDRLHRDLLEAGFPATYDKLALDVGDSIVEKISALIRESACIIGVVSPSSISSKWVQRELAWALTGELAGRSVRILPAVVGDCELPPMLADKLFADFRRQYFPALRSVIQALRRSMHMTPAAGPVRYDGYLLDCEQLETTLALDDRDAAFTWLQAHPALVGALVANPRDIVMPAPNFAATPHPPTLVCWTLASYYLWHLVCLGPVSGTGIVEDRLWEEAERLMLLARAYAADVPNFVQACALTEPGAALTQLVAAVDQRRVSGDAPADLHNVDDHGRAREAVLDRLILLAGRRDDHSSDLLEIRRRAKRELGVEIKSYDWLLEALGGKLYRVDAATPEAR